MTADGSSREIRRACNLLDVRFLASYTGAELQFGDGIGRSADLLFLPQPARRDLKGITMSIRIALCSLSAVVLLGGAMASPGNPSSTGQSDGPYEPMAPFANDPTSGGVKVRVGNGVEDEYRRRAFPTDAAGNLEVAVQYQVKLPVRYGPGGELCRVVVQAVNTPGCCGGEWTFDQIIPLEPFMVGAGDHVNEVTVVKIPPPASPEGAAIRVVVEQFEGEGEWAEQSVKTVHLAPR